VVRDQDWMAVMELERQVAEASGDLAGLEPMGRAAAMVGSLLKCPECARLTLVMQGDRESFVREEPASGE